MKNKRIVILFISLLIVVLTACQIKNNQGTNTRSTVDSMKQPTLDQTDYQKAVSAFTKVSLSEVQEKLAKGESFYLYFGRETCHYCQQFVPKLQEALQESSQVVFYLDSDEGDIPAIKAFAEKQGIQTVPNFALYQNGKLDHYLIEGSQSTVQEIREFLAGS